MSFLFLLSSDMSVSESQMFVCTTYFSLLRTNSRVDYLRIETIIHLNWNSVKCSIIFIRLNIPNRAIHACRYHTQTFFSVRWAFKNPYRISFFLWRTNRTCTNQIRVCRLSLSIIRNVNTRLADLIFINRIWVMGSRGSMWPGSALTWASLKVQCQAHVCFLSYLALWKHIEHEIVLFTDDISLLIKVKWQQYAYTISKM